MSESPETDQLGNTRLYPEYLGYGVRVALVRHGGLTPDDYCLSVWRTPEFSQRNADGLVEHVVSLTDEEIEALLHYRARMRSKPDVD